jgi:hypothetical protein
VEKVFICGIPGNGKGLLRTLLDGHSEIITCPFQGFGNKLISNDFDKKLLLKRPYDVLERLKKTPSTNLIINSKIITIGEVINLLSPTLTQILDASISRLIRAASAQEKEVFIEFNFEFIRFFENFISSLEHKSSMNWTPETLIDRLIGDFIKSWKNINNNSNSRYFVQTAHNGVDIANNILKKTSNSNIIFVRRDPAAMIFTNTKRMLLKLYGEEGYKKLFDNRNSLVILNKYSRVFFSKSYIQKIKKYEDYLKSMNHKNVHIVNFEDLVFKTQQAMEEVSNFLNIDYEKSLECASLNSIQLESKNNKFIGKINDDPTGHISRIHGLILNKILN